ncbi:unnamed protein product [Arabidopsis lyrata]|nr:unnamed protein product [Arabidopsis lyrata]
MFRLSSGGGHVRPSMFTLVVDTRDCSPTPPDSGNKANIRRALNEADGKDAIRTERNWTTRGISESTKAAMAKREEGYQRSRRDV